MKKTLFAALTILFFSACSKSDSGNSNQQTPTPNANFSYTLFNNNLHAPATVNFSNSSTNYTSLSWNFGGQGTSTSTNPTFRFTSAGSYNVKLTASYGSTSSNLSEQTINILAPYTQVRISEIKLTSISSTSSFDGYFKITDANGNQIFKSANITINPNQLPRTFSLTTPQVLTNINATYYVEVWDYNLLSNDVRISRTPFIPNLYNKGNDATDSYPTSINGIQGISLNIGWQ